MGIMNILYKKRMRVGGSVTKKNYCKICISFFEAGQESKGKLVITLHVVWTMVIQCSAFLDQPLKLSGEWWGLYRSLIN